MFDNKSYIACKLKYSYCNNRASILRVYEHIHGRSMGFHEFWKRRIERCKIDLVIEGHKLYNPEQLYKIFVNEQWAARYIEKQKLRSWEELVAHVEEREEYEKDKRNGIGYVW